VTLFSDNAAGRLHAQIISFRKHAVGQGSIPHVWAGVLDLHVNDPRLLPRLAHIFRLPDEIAHELEMVDEKEYDRDLALRWQGAVNGRLSEWLFNNSNSAQLVTAIDDTALTSLEYSSVILHRFRPQRVFSRDELQHIRDLIAELREEIRNDTGMDQSLWEFLLSHAHAMSEALDDLPLRGPAALEDAYDRARGAVIRRTDLLVRMDENPGPWKKFGKLIIAVGTVLGIPSAGLALPGQIRQAIEGPPPDQPAIVIELPGPGPVVLAVQHNGDGD
jgi:hypothetical protein